MWRAFFLAIGITLAILGGECLIVEKAEVSWPANNEPPPQPTYLSRATYLPGSEFLLGSKPVVDSSKTVITPSDWAAWTLLSAGAVIALYSVSVARQ